MKGRRQLVWLSFALILAAVMGLFWSLSTAAREGPARAADLPSQPGDGPPQSQGGGSSFVDPALRRRMAEGGDRPLRVIVRLDPPADDVTAQARAPSGGGDRQAWIAAMQTSLDRRRERISALLDRAQTSGALVEERSFWIAQSLALEAHPSLVRELMEAPGIAGMWLDQYRTYVDPMQAESTSLATSWGISHVRAPEVWQTLGISGTGAVVAVMDTGVDLEHPALKDRYRGNLGGGLYAHGAAWYDAVHGGYYPYDDHGHGTHVAGTAVGVPAIGVAPGSRWIAVKVLDHNGSGYDSWILSGFQWLLAPGGDPDLAPDVVNASWGARDASRTVFEASIQNLKDAGIFPVFAAGNNGPSDGSVGSPASNQGVFAVGASDPDDGVAYFSSRGPSPWDEVKPYVVAPGVNILSSQPGGIYGTKNGTSMAAPHVSGLGALLRSVSPTISIESLAEIITRTAVPLSDTVPNHVSGWGRIDAYDAVLAVAHPSFVKGYVSDTDGAPLTGIEIKAEPLQSPPLSGRANRTVSNAEGFYRMALLPGRYDLTAQGFGYVPEVVRRVSIFADTTQHFDFRLTARPTGTLHGQVWISGTTHPPTLPVSVRIHQTPLSETLSPSGAFGFSAPSGSYTVEVRGNGYRVVTATTAITVDETSWLTVSVETAPRLLLVDEGTAYYASEIGRWRDALDTLCYDYDLEKLRWNHIPSSQTLQGYDTVLWSSPAGSPGIVAAGPALKAYLEGGGRLLLSGRNVAFFDGGGTISGGGLQSYLYDLMGVSFWSQGPQPQVLGAGPFAGLRAALAGSDGTGDPVTPDSVRIADPDRAVPAWRYGDDTTAGVATSRCTPFRSLFFSFGFEGIADPAHRTEVMGRSLDWLTKSPLTAGLSLERVGRPRQVGTPGNPLTHTLRVRHLGVAGITDTITLSILGSDWPAVLSPTHATLTPCASIAAQVLITVPESTGVDVSALTTVSVQSALDPAGHIITLTSKTPAPVLLVDDDRWYPMESYYTRALERAGLDYDLWDIEHNLGGIPGARSPSTKTLLQYPFVVWFTGYDWYAPIRDEEAPRLERYLDEGGRLLISSQSFLDYHFTSALAERLGVMAVEAAFEPTQASAVVEHPAGGRWGPVALVYPYQNWSYGVEPDPEAQTVVRGQWGQPLAIAARDPTNGRPSSLFYAVPLETLPEGSRVDALSAGIGWLSPLGESTWSVEPRWGYVGEVFEFSLGIRNRADEPVTVEVSHTVPTAMSILTPLEGGLKYNALSRRITWQGVVSPEATVPLTWRAKRVGGDREPLTATVELSLPEQKIAFDRAVTCCGVRADLRNSDWLSPVGSMRTAAPVTLTFALVNESPFNLEGGEVRLWMMQGAAPISVTSPLTHGVHRSWWQGSLPAGASRTLTLPIRGWDWQQPVRVDALMESDDGSRWERSLWLAFEPWTRYLPIIFKMP